MVESKGSEGSPSMELPSLCEGVWDEVRFDLLSDRNSFINKALVNLKEENPILARLVTESSLISPEPEISLNWALAYYDLYSRSAKRTNQKMLIISNDVANSFYDAQSRDLNRAMASSQEEVRGVFDEEDKALMQIRSEEVDKDKQMGEFWTVTYLRQANMALTRSTVEVEIIFRPLTLTQLLLHRQKDVNRFNSKFPS